MHEFDHAGICMRIRTRGFHPARGRASTAVTGAPIRIRRTSRTQSTATATMSVHVRVRIRTDILVQYVIPFESNSAREVEYACRVTARAPARLGVACATRIPHINTRAASWQRVCCANVCAPCTRTYHTHAEDTSHVSRCTWHDAMMIMTMTACTISLRSWRTAPTLPLTCVPGTGRVDVRPPCAERSASPYV